MAFIRNRPTAAELLSNSQSLILNNFNGSDDTFGVDHYKFSDATANNGRHRDIHIVKRTGNATNISNVYTVFSKDYTPDTTGGTADTQLFGITGNGGVSQLTGNSATSEGFQWLGGLLIQWGFVSVTTTNSGTVTFKDRAVGSIPFPTTCFSITATLTFNGVLDVNDRNTVFIEKNNAPSPSNTQFKWKTIIEDTTIRGFFWIAIGN